MADIIALQGDDRAKHDDLMIEYHKARHRVFIEEKGWKLNSTSGLEIDQYDNRDATYIIAVEGSRVVGGQRMLPTTGPHMLAEIFPDLASIRGVPEAPDIYEWTRYFVVPERRRFSRVDARLLAAMQAFCIERRIKAVTAVVETWWLQRWAQVGFRSHPLGLPSEIAGQPTIAVSVDISEDAFLRVARLAGLLRQQPADLR